MCATTLDCESVNKSEMTLAGEELSAGTRDLSNLFTVFAPDITHVFKTLFGGASNHIIHQNGDMLNCRLQLVPMMDNPSIEPALRKLGTTRRGVSRRDRQSVTALRQTSHTADTLEANTDRTWCTPIPEQLRPAAQNSVEDGSDPVYVVTSDDPCGPRLYST